LRHGLAGEEQTDSRSPQRHVALKHLLSWVELMSIFSRLLEVRFTRSSQKFHLVPREVYIRHHLSVRLGVLLCRASYSLLLHIGHQLDHDLTTALYHPKNWRPLFLQGPSPSFAFEPTSASLSALALHHLRLAFMTRNHIGFVALHFV